MRIVVVGTGTSVGKTHVSRSLARWARDQGLVCAAVKPIESGGDDDGRALANASAFHVKPPPYLLRRPVSPHLAARAERTTISIRRVAAWVARAGRGCDLVIVETAGGLFSPLSTRRTNVDLLQALLPAQILLVAPDRLGVLHDVRALLSASCAAGVPAMTTALSEPPKRDASTGTNARELARLGICDVAVSFPRGDPLGLANLRAAGKLIQALQRQTRTR